eukprot:Sspe_Gene.96167::Locus_68649_Transcript_1_1_Confidence_1.000_Length_390::g.96167::m.96167
MVSWGVPDDLVRYDVLQASTVTLSPFLNGAPSSPPPPSLPPKVHIFFGPPRRKQETRGIFQSQTTLSPPPPSPLLFFVLPQVMERVPLCEMASSSPAIE